MICTVNYLENDENSPTWLCLVTLYNIEYIYIYIYFYIRIIIIKSKGWTFTHCLGLSHKTMVCAVCLSIFLFLSTLSHQLESDLYISYAIVNVVFRSFTISSHASSLFDSVIYVQEPLRKQSVCVLLSGILDVCLVISQRHCRCVYYRVI